MSNQLRHCLRATSLGALWLLATTALPSNGWSALPAGTEVTVDTARWICERADNICGLDDARTLSNPAKVDYDALLKVTPEYKKMRDERIDPNSAEGIQLRQKGSERVRDACEKVRADKGYCSVWKTIKNSDGRAVPEITDAVKEKI